MNFWFFLKFLVKTYTFVFWFCFSIAGLIFLFNPGNQEDFDLWHVIVWFRHHYFMLIVLMLATIPGAFINRQEQQAIPRNPRW